MEDQQQNADHLTNPADCGPSFRKGHLKIFFGYAPGVGKTYAMLKAAHLARRQGVDVVAGCIEFHAHPLTASLLKGIESLPLSRLSENGLTSEEFDLDAAIRRKPQLILLDELAHTNAAGSRHHKRYQDVEELLASGIDVYSTVNVQHIESLNDVVSSITGESVDDRIPDYVFDKADQVELIDIEPAELMERFNADNEKQKESSFQETMPVANLTALREIALRRCADRVNLLTSHLRGGTRSGLRTEEHILVCLSSSPSNAKIIRTAARMAAAFKGEFTALFVRTSDFSAMTEENRDRLRDNTRLAQQLGAQVETMYGDDIAYQIAEFARLSGATKIVIGRSNTTRRRFPGKLSLTEKLIESAPDLDVHIIPDHTETAPYRPERARTFKFPAFMADIGKCICILLLATLVGFLFAKIGFTEANIITVYILAVLIISVITSSRMYSLAASFVSVLIFNFYFTAPKLTLRVADSGYPVTFVVMFLAAFIMGSLAARLKEHAKQSARTAYRTKVLLETNQLLQREDSREGILSAAAGQIVKLLRRDVVAYLPEGKDLGQPRFFASLDEEFKQACVSGRDKAASVWVLENNKHAGATTDTLSDARSLYLAIRAGAQVYGIVGVDINGHPLDIFENSILLSILGECAMAFQNEKNAREKEETAVLAKNEQLRARLLRAIAHDLRTPLTSISGNASNLMSATAHFDDETRRQIYSDIYDDSVWLINLVENILSVTRIEEGGSVNIRRSPELMDEVISEALLHIDRRCSTRKITVKSSEEYILAQIDPKLIIQVIINIVNNAIRYTPEGSEITISTERRDGKVIVRVADNGTGIPDEVKPRIFDMFYSGANQIADSRRSLGLGLSLCKSIVQAHGGELTVEDNRPGGAVFMFTLPAGEIVLHE